MLSEGDMREFERLQRDHHNTHAALLNLSPESPVAEISVHVNHLAFLMVNQGLRNMVVDGEELDMQELRRALKWQASLIKKLQIANRRVYFIMQSGNSIIL